MSFYFSACLRVFSVLFLFLHGLRVFLIVVNAGIKKEEVVLCLKCV